MSAPLLSLEGLGVRFGGLVALDGFSMNVAPGAIHALIGPNGAGKSTVLNAISHFYPPSKGEILFDGRTITHIRPHQLARLGIARTFQNVELCAQMTVLENVIIGMTSRIPGYFYFGPSRARSRIERETILEAERLLEEGDLSSCRDVVAGELDFGRQKRLDLLRAIACKPRLLLLDEPAAGLRNREISALDSMLVDLARTRGVTILLVEHVMQLVMSVADRITVLSQGRAISEGTPQEVRNDPLVIEAYLGKRSHVEG